MRAVLTAALCFSLCLIVPVEAQRRLPRKSAPERQVEDINRNLRQEQNQRAFEQQIQTETNQLRQSIDRQRMFSTPPTPSPALRRSTCPVGSVGCR